MKLITAAITPQAGNAVTFAFAPAEPIIWQAGQSIRLEVPGDYGPLEHRFTISSAPHEGVIAITTRPSASPYKQSLFNLTPGDTIDAFAVEGTFTWRDTTLRHVFVAAGIGITPFRALIKERLHAGLPIAATLVYSSPTSDIIFKDELDQWAAAHPEFAVHYIIGERIRAPQLEQLADLSKSLLYVSGPSSMVDELCAALQKSHGVLDSQLVRDWFTGRLPQDG